MSRPAGALIAVPIVVALLLGTVGSVMFGFGIKTACTTFRDELSACDRVDVAVWLNLVAQTGLATGLLVAGARRRRGASVALVGAGLVAAVVLFGGFVALADSWRWT